MGKLKERFGNISKKVFDKMSSLERQPIAKYNNMMRNIRKWESQIDVLKGDIDKLNGKIKSYESKCRKLYNENKILEEEYSMNFNVSTNTKTLANGRKGIFWMINLKYKGMTKPIYLGSDKNVREIVNKALENKGRLSKDRLKSEIYDMCFDKLYIMVTKEKNMFDRKISFDDLI